MPALVAGFARAGLDVTLEVTADPGRWDVTLWDRLDLVTGAATGGPATGWACPAGIDVSVYRVVEEALTNAVRHPPRVRSRSGCTVPTARCRSS